jgi:hypothetical protein
VGCDANSHASVIAFLGNSLEDALKHFYADVAGGLFQSAEQELDGSCAKQYTALKCAGTWVRRGRFTKKDLMVYLENHGTPPFPSQLISAQGSRGRKLLSRTFSSTTFLPTRSRSTTPLRAGIR